MLLHYAPRLLEQYERREENAHDDDCYTTTTTAITGTYVGNLPREKNRLGSSDRLWSPSLTATVDFWSNMGVQFSQPRTYMMTE